MAKKNTPLAGRLKERIRIETPVHADDGQGGITPAWELLAEVWAEMTPLLPKQNEAIDQLKDTRLRCVIRGHLVVNTSCRVLWNNNQYAIYWVEPALSMSDYSELLIKSIN